MEIKPMTSIEDAVHSVLDIATRHRMRYVADFNGFIIDSKNSYDKNLDLYWSYMGRPNKTINWEQRRYEIAKVMLPTCVEEYSSMDDFRIEKGAEYAVMCADALIKELQKKGASNEKH